MTITYPLTFPTTPRARKARMMAVNVVATSESVFSFSTQKQISSGQRWEMDIELPPLTKAEAGQWIAFITSMKGVRGTCLVPEPDRLVAQGTATGTPVVNTGSQTGASLLTKGWSNAVTNILKAGDMIQIGNYMYMNLVNVNSGASGSATLDIWPDLRSSPTDLAPITTSNCKTLMRLATNQQAWSTDELEHYGLQLTFIEEVPSS